jgi:hypothetical protein
MARHFIVIGYRKLGGASWNGVLAGNWKEAKRIAEEKYSLDPVTYVFSARTCLYKRHGGM